MIELSGDPQWQGLLDPLRVGDEHTREDLATSFLVDLLPIPFPATWRTEIRRAVQAVVGRPQARQATCLDVVRSCSRARRTRAPPAARSRPTPAAASPGSASPRPSGCRRASPPSR